MAKSARLILASMPAISTKRLRRSTRPKLPFASIPMAATFSQAPRFTISSGDYPP